MIHDCVELQNKLIRIPVWRYSLLCDIIQFEHKCCSFYCIASKVAVSWIVMYYDLYNNYMIWTLCTCS